VFYDQTYYIGRVTAYSDSEATMKFLHRVGGEIFDWPKRPDVDTVPSVLLYRGPLSIQGHGPFSFTEIKLVEKQYKELRVEQLQLIQQKR